MTDAIHAFGTTLLKGGIGGVKIAEVTNIGGLELDSDEIDVTSHDSTNGFEEVIQGIRRTGEVALEGNFIPSDTTGQIALYTDFLTGAVDDYAIVFPAVMGAVWEFEAFVKQAPSTEAPFDDKVPFTATLRVTGVPSLSIGASNNLSALAGIEEELGGAITLSPAFAAATYSYAVFVETTSTWIKLTPTAAGGVITINGFAVTSGSESGEIPLGAAGSVTEVVVTVKETNNIPVLYTLSVARP